VLGRGNALSPEQQAHRQLMDLLDQARKARRPYDAEAWLNLAFFLSEQYTEWNGPS
jgi:hypothetical protein